MGAASNSSNPGRPLWTGSPVSGAAIEPASSRLGFLTTLAVAALALTAFALYLGLALQWGRGTFPGIFVTPALVVDQTTPVEHGSWPGLAAGLMPGDRIVSLNGDDLGATLDALDRFHALSHSLAPGQRISVGFERPADRLDDTAAGVTCAEPRDGVAQCVVDYTVAALPRADLVALALIPFATALALLAAGLIVLRMRAHQPTALIVSALCFSQSIFTAGLFDRLTTHALIPVWLLATLALAACFGLLAIYYPVHNARLNARPYWRFLPPTLAAVLGLIVLSLDARSPSPAVLSGEELASFAALAGAAVFAFSQIRRRRLAVLPAQRDQSNLALIGVLLASAPLLLWGINLLLRPLFGYEPLALNLNAATPFLALPALSAVYAVLQYRAGDTDRALSQTVTYGLMALALVVAYFLLVFGVALLAGEVAPANDPGLMAAVIFVIALFFVPFRTRLQSMIDRLYFRQRVNYQLQVEAFARELTLLASRDDIIAAYRSEIQRSLGPEHVIVFLPDPQSGDFVAAGNAPDTDLRFDRASTFISRLGREEYLYLEPGKPWPADLIVERARLLILDSLVLLGLHGSEGLNGFVSVGKPRSGKAAYDHEELRYLQSLTRQISVVIERTQVVDALERRAHELGVLTQVGQAVNFTLEFDDLLELISAQTDRLIRATHFYIVLRDEATDELYFAFYVEDDERYRERENLRWPPGRDLFSEVVRTGQALRFSDYARAVVERGGSVRPEDARIKAWMAVPLVTGQRTLGVMAAGSSQPNQPFSDGQLRIFTDIAALAATAIDKARLFNETNERARQLAALYDVSRQLAVVEFDLEKLLTLITDTAVNILDAEAGALLLTVDDDSRELELRVATGIDGEQVAGRRVSPAQSVAGTVVQTGQPLVVNDAARDPRWSGDLAGSFPARTLLAVPLIAQNRVIGVLEVLNKRGDLPFRQDDLNLLATFAGQAAVAIENARLFQMTDFQLSQRVAELEAMERVDVELNRSLDLSTVADITVRYAMEYSGATGGVLGLLADDERTMRGIVALGEPLTGVAGQPDGEAWLVERGLVQRVLRSRRPELVADIGQDPESHPQSAAPVSQMAVPMVSGNKVTAILLLEANREPYFNLAHLAYVQRLAEHASVAIANALLYAELDRANQSKSEFVSFVAHELKNPLTSVKGYADILISGAVGQLSDQQRSFLMTIRANAERMDTLVSDLNDVTKLQTNNMRIELAPVAFSVIVEETARPLQKQIDDKGQRLIIDLPADLPPVMGDKNRLIQVMVNLVSNAHKYTPEGGMITISAAVENSRRDSKGELRGPLLHVAVRDNGIGMSEEDLSRLFTPYFRSDNPLAREQPGTGLGLTITSGLIERHGGEIWVESQIGQGTTFHFTLPLAGDAA